MTVRQTVKEQAEIIKSGAQYQAVKKHVKKHKMKYAIGTTIVITSGVTFFVTRRFGVQTITVAPVFNNTVSPVINNNIVNNAGHLCKHVTDRETGYTWLKINYLAEELAKEHNIPFESVRNALSKHLNGWPGYEEVFGRKYYTSGLGTAA